MKRLILSLAVLLAVPLFGEDAASILARVDRSRNLFVHHRNDLPGDDGQDDAGADRAEKKDRQRESKSGGSEELTERRHESCNRRRGPC